jgi:hypothetical protein
MGAAVAAILTCILRENKKLSSSSCIAFGPGTYCTAFHNSLEPNHLTYEYQEK